MHIHNNGISTNINTNQKAANSAGEKTTHLPQPDNSSSTQDSVILSPEAHSLKQLETTVANAPDVDATKVENIRQSIADGSYAINSESIAEKMLTVDNL